MKPEPTIYQVRERLAGLARGRRCSLAALSRMIGRPDRYLDRYVRDGYPERLHGRDISDLAAFFGATERELGRLDNPPLT